MSERLRVVSLLPAATEVVCELGLDNLLVGRSHACDFPSSIRKLPTCTRCNLDLSQSSVLIDHEIKSRQNRNQAVFSLDTQMIQSLRPDIILAQDHCSVCAIDLEEVASALPGRASRDTKPKLVSFSPGSLDDLWNQIRSLSSHLGAPEKGAALVRHLWLRLRSLTAEIRVDTHRPTVACLEWLDPLMAAGNWVPELVDLAGGTNLFGETGEHSPSLTWEALCEHDPEVLVLMPCGFDLSRLEQEWRILSEKSGWSGLRAVQNGRVFLVDGNQYFNRPGPRLIDSLEILMEILHPDEFQAKPARPGWKKLDPVPSQA